MPVHGPSSEHIARCAGYFSYDKETAIWSLEMDASKCARRYLFGWAFVDIVSVVPFDLILLANSDLHGKLKVNIIRLPRCLKLLRLPRLFRWVP
jgi:hypothetical protein